MELEEISPELTVQHAIQAEIRDCKPYIDVIHEQIGGSMAESEREVTALIEQLNMLNSQSARQMERITQSVQGERALTEVMNSRIEKNNESIARLEAKLREQADELQANFEQVRTLAEDVNALSPILEVISSIATQTKYLALNAEIEAVHAGNAGRCFSIIAKEVRELAKRSTAAAADIADKLNATTINVAAKMREAQKAIERNGIDNLQELFDELGKIQQDFRNSCNVQRDVISSVERGHKESVSCLLEAMGHVQFQDVMRQRMGHVQEALVDMRDHLLNLSQVQTVSAAEGLLATNFKTLLEASLQGHRMASQTMTHLSVTGGDSQSNDSRPAIELF